jgi:acetylcholinesterase
VFCVFCGAPNLLAMSFYRSLIIATAISSLIADIAANPVRPKKDAGPIVDLGYAKYEGTTLTSGVNQFLGLRYAAAPLGDLRFRGPACPAEVAGVQDANTVIYLLQG